MNHFWNTITTTVSRGLIELIVWDIVKIIIFFIVAKIIINVTNKIVDRLLNMQRARIDKRRKATLESLFNNVIRYTVYFLLVVEILSTFHVNIAALLAGAGIVGLAVGFGAQGLIKDILTGLFILFEDQYGVGDTVKVNGFMGTVVSIGVRLTRVQAWTGEIEVIPNGQISTVTNFSRSSSIAVVEVGVSYGTNLNQAVQTIERVMQHLKETEADIIGDVSVLGVQSLRDSDVLIRAIAECNSMTQYGIQRKAQKLIKEAFDESGIEIPFPQRTVWVQQESQQLLEDRGQEA